MNYVLIPEWIKKIKAKDDAERSAAEIAKQKAEIASLRIKQDGPEFWRQLLKELAINAESLSEIGLQGSLSKSADSESEEHCRVHVAMGTIVRQAYTDLVYKSGSPTIHCRTVESEVERLYFTIDSTSPALTLLPEGGSSHMDPERAAQYIVERLVRLIRQ